MSSLDPIPTKLDWVDKRLLQGQEFQIYLWTYFLLLAWLNDDYILATYKLQQLAG